MRAGIPGLWSVVAAASGVLLLADAALSTAQSGRASASRCWAEGDAADALELLASAPRTRETELNSAVVSLYSGRAAEAAATLAALRARDAGWTPALRWSARAQAELGRPEAVEDAAALLDRRDASVIDRLWAGDLLLRHGRVPQAQAAFDAVLRWNDGVKIDWQRLPGAQPAAAASVAGPAGTTAPHLRLASELGATERLRYEVKYLFLHLADVTLETGALAEHDGVPARRVVFTARSGNGVPFFRIDSRFESVLAADGSVLAHRHTSSDSDDGAEEAGYDMDRRSGRCTVRTARNGVFSYHVLPLPENAQDGVSVLLAARALARVRGSAVLPTAVDGLWWPTHLRTVGSETIRWRGRDRPAVRLQSTGRYRGAAGVSGTVDIWVSDDERALPYKVKMKVAVGSVVLELLPEQELVASSAPKPEVAR